MKNKACRILDANFNRSREGLRVAEEVARFVLDKKILAAELKRLRHEVTGVYKTMDRSELLLSRDSKNDVGRSASVLERPRADMAEIFWANMERAKEAMRVLEEVSKLRGGNESSVFKRIRFELYGIEKKSYHAVEALRDRRQGRGR